MRLTCTGLPRRMDGPSRLVVVLAAIGMVVGCNSPASDASESPERGLSLRLAKRQSSGGVVCIEARLCNQGSQPIEIVPLLMPQDYFISFSVVDADGRDVRFVGPERRVVVPDKEPLGVGECFSSKFGLRSLFALPANGTLRVAARYWDNLIEPDKSTVVLASNVLKVEAASLGTSKSCKAPASQR